MTGTAELAVREDEAPALRVPVLPNLPDTDTWIRAMASIAKLAAQICNTSFVPKGMRGDDAAVTACILTGRELGLGPMTSLRHIHVVEGIPSLDAEYKRAKVQSLGHEFDIIEWDHDHCIVSGRRKGSKKPPLIVSYTIGDARRAELVKGGSNYVKRPKVMMLARATTLMCSALFSDVTNGLATTELLESGDEDAVADAIGASLPAPEQPRRGVTAEQARQRAPQHVTAELVTSDPSPAGTEQPPAPQPSANPPADVPPAGEGRPPQRASSGQVGLIQKQFERLGMGGEDQRDGRVRVASAIAGRVLVSTKELTPDDARKVKDTLESLRDGTDLDGLLAELAMADDPREQDGTASGGE